MKGTELLGLKVEDKVTKRKGVVTSISYDLYGCVQAMINPEAKNNKVEEVMEWYDVHRLKVLSKKPVMELPDFAEEIEVKKKPKGSARKPMKF